MKGYGAEFREPRNVNHFVLLNASPTGGRLQGCEIKALPALGIRISEAGPDLSRSSDGLSRWQFVREEGKRRLLAVPREGKGWPCPPPRSRLRGQGRREGGRNQALTRQGPRQEERVLQNVAEGIVVVGLCPQGHGHGQRRPTDRPTDPRIGLQKMALNVKNDGGWRDPRQRGQILAFRP